MEGACLPVADLSEVDLDAAPSSGEEYLAFVRMEAAAFRSVQRAPPQQPASKQTVFSRHKDVAECPFEYRALPTFRAKLHDWFTALRSCYSSHKQSHNAQALAASELPGDSNAARTAPLPRASNTLAWSRILRGEPDRSLSPLKCDTATAPDSCCGDAALQPLLPLLHDLSHAQLCALFTTWGDIVQPLPQLPAPALTWLFALLTAVEMPVDGDTMCALRRLVLLLCKQRALLVQQQQQQQQQQDGADVLHRINVLLCILGSVFGQFGVSEG
jgi:hypothetical protein